MLQIDYFYNACTQLFDEKKNSPKFNVLPLFLKNFFSQALYEVLHENYYYCPSKHPCIFILRPWQTKTISGIMGASAHLK